MAVLTIKLPEYLWLAKKTAENDLSN